MGRRGLGGSSGLGGGCTRPEYQYQPVRANIVIYNFSKRHKT